MDTIRENSFLMIKKVILFNILFITISAQDADSLFWFDMSKVRDPVPKTPMILDKVFSSSQLGMLDSLKNMLFSGSLFLCRGRDATSIG